jgi:EmrB/QacA subfamily drug resistance transporter
VTARQPTVREAPRAAPPLDRAVIVVGLVVICGQIMAILDTTIVNVALDTLSRELHASLSATQWVITGYLLALGLIIPLSGWASGRFGTKAVWIAALVLFTCGSALSGLAWSIGSLIAFRVIQGLGGGMMMPLAQTIMTRAAGPERLGRVMAILGVPMLLGPVFGPVIGGVLVQDVSWHWIFYVNVPVGVAAVALAIWKLPHGREAAAGGSFDLPGLVLLAGSLVMLLYGLSRASSAGGFTGSGVLPWLIGGGACLVAFTGYSLVRRDAAVVNVWLFGNSTFAASCVLMFVVAIALFGGMLLLPLYYQVVRGQGALNAGLLMAPQGLGAMVSMPVAGRITDKAGPGRVIPVGIVLVILGTLPFTVVGADTSYAWLTGALFVRGLGVGATMMPVFAAAYRRLPRERVPQGATTLSALVQVGGSFGTAVLVMALSGRITHNFAAHGLAAHGSGTGQLSAIPRALLARVAPLLAGGFGYAFWLALALTAAAMLPALVLLRQGARDPAQPLQHDDQHAAHGEADGDLAPDSAAQGQRPSGLSDKPDPGITGQGAKSGTAPRAAAARPLGSSQSSWRPRAVRSSSV